MVYLHEIPVFGVTFEVDRLRRSRGELVGELTTKCNRSGIRAVDGVVFTADFNFSSARARTERAKILQERAPIKDHDWSLALEDLCQRVMAAEREGEPAVDLETADLVTEHDYQVDGWSFPRRLPAILFGDGGTGKSYLALYLAGRMVESGLRVGFFDWELSVNEQRDRLGRLFAPRLPSMAYVRCERPLVIEADRLRRIIHERRLDYVFCDSVAYASDGPPEDADVAERYFRSVRAWNIGSLHIAHVNRSEDHDKKPFGSVFWHNSARSTWFIKASEPALNGNGLGHLKLGIYQRKSNIGRLAPASAYDVTFGSTTIFRREAIQDIPDLAAGLSIRQRMYHLLKHGSMPIEELAEKLDANPESVKRTSYRYRDFIVLPSGRIAIREHRDVNG